MPRLQPKEGYMTAAQVCALAGISDAMLSRLVDQGTLDRFGPAERKHKFYSERQVRAWMASREVYPEEEAQKEKVHYPSYPTLARADDMPAIVEISRSIFNTDGSEPIPAEVRLAWLRKNPETFLALRRAGDGVIVGYACILPLREETIARFIKDEISAEEITAEDVEVYLPGRAKYLYIMAVGIDPQYPFAAKHAYGARLLGAIFDFLLGLGERGVDITVITARSRMPDGVRLLRKMGIPQIKPPRKKDAPQDERTHVMALFQLHVQESGLPLFLDYQERLAGWRAGHVGRAPLPFSDPGPALSPLALPRRAPSRAPNRVSVSSLPDLPDGLVPWRGFATLHGISETTVHKAIHGPSHRIPVVTEGGPWRWTSVSADGQPHTGRVNEVLDAAGRRRFWEIYSRKTDQFEECPECPHEV